MGMDYAAMLPSPQFGPRFKFEKKEENPEMPIPNRRRKQEALPVCPINLESDECISECDRDNDCTEFQICCKSGCSTACIDQDLTEEKNQKNKVEEEEEIKVTLACPQVDSNLNCTQIKEMCSTDSDCDFDQKCCQVRCSMRCIGPRPKGNKRRPENRRSRGKDKMKSSRIESLYPKNNNIMLSNSRGMYPNNYFNQQSQYFPRFGINYGN